MTLHLSPDELLSLVFDATAPAIATEHLATCTQCRQQFAELRELADDLAIARLSTPKPTALARYHALFDQVQRQPNLLTRVVQQVRAVLTWDSRQHPLLQGVRSASANAYRQLYAADGVELELMVEQVGRLRRIEGDLIVDDGDAPALLELVESDGTSAYAVETEADGIFRLGDVLPGRYRAVITRPHAATIEVEALEIA